MARFKADLSNGNGNSGITEPDNSAITVSASELPVSDSTAQLGIETDPDLEAVLGATSYLSDEELIEHIYATLTNEDKLQYAEQIFAKVRSRMNLEIKSNFDSDPQTTKKMILRLS